VFINGCSCRLHGESKIVPGSLNLALHVGDDRELVLRNRARFAGALGVDAARFTTCAQVHGSRVQVVENFGWQRRPGLCCDRGGYGCLDYPAAGCAVVVVLC
jgi:copper oxidase (laccase) domain-containing protein